MQKILSKFMLNLMSKFAVFFLSLLMLGGLMGGSAMAAADIEFSRWIDGLYPEARQEGIRRTTWETAFAGVTEVDAAVLEKANYQPEFTTEIWDYLDARVNPLSLGKGEKMAKYYARTLAEVEQKFGVEQSVLLAIWSMESNYGAIFDKPERLHYVPR